MIARFGFIFLLLVFGLLMFAAGAMAPEALRQRIGALGSDALARLAATVATAAPAVAAVSASKAAAVPAAAVNTPAVAAPPAAGPQPVLADSLLIPTPLPAKASYGLQAGQFVTIEAAQALARQLKSLYLPCVPAIAVVDRAGLNSFVVAVGPYGSAAAARAARAEVALALGQPAPPLILLPPPAPAGVT